MKSTMMDVPLSLNHLLERAGQLFHRNVCVSGLPDKRENYHMVTIDLTGEGLKTSVTLSQDNNATADAREHSENNWRVMLEGLKRVVETP